MTNVVELRQKEFDARQAVRELRRAVFEVRNLAEMPRLVEAETTLQRLSEERAAAETKQGIDHGRIVAVRPTDNLLGPTTTGLDVTVDLRMSAVPTSLVHLFNATDQPLVSYQIENLNDKTKRMRLISYVEGYSAKAVETLEIAPHQTATSRQMPTFFADGIAKLTEATRASVNVEVQDLDEKTEVHRTIPVWLLARSTAPLQIKDPSTGKWKDMTDYLGAYVTPNAPDVMRYLRLALDKQPSKRLVGYQVSPEKRAAGQDVDVEEVASEVKALYDALKESGVAYVNSVIDFTPETGTANNQRVRVPRESLSDRSANCIDGTVLMASLLEGISLNPALVIVPGHAFLAWETWRNNQDWRYVETTMISTHSFEDACAQAEQMALSLKTHDPTRFKQKSLRDLRAAGISPLE
jgi:hypothetical protein